MSQLLDLVYSVAVSLVAILGVAGVLLSTTDGVEGGRSWTNLLLVGVTAAFLAVLVWSLAVDPML